MIFLLFQDIDDAIMFFGSINTVQYVLRYFLQIWRGTWQGNDVVAKILNVKQCTMRMARDFSEEFPRLRIFNHPNILAVLAANSQPPHLVMISQYMNLGSLYNILHGAQTGIFN